MFDDPRLTEAQNYDKQLALHRKSQRPAEQLLARNPDNPEYRQRLATVRHNTANVLYARGQYAAAVELYRPAAAVAASLAVELAPIRVNAVAPGVVRSPLWSAMTEADREGMYAGLAASLPLGRVAEPDDAAKAFLALMDQDYVTGTVSVVDGGTLTA